MMTVTATTANRIDIIKGVLKFIARSWYVIWRIFEIVAQFESILLITSRTAKLWPGGPLAFDLHQHTSLLALAFSLFHGLVLLGDQYIGYTLVEVLVPFASTGYKPLAVGAGQVALYVLVLVALSFYVKQQLGRQVWRLIHAASFALFGLALLHGIASGSDSGTWWAQALYWLSGGSVLFLTVYRVLVLRPVLRRA
jgi:predicted ferric reductase